MDLPGGEAGHPSYLSRRNSILLRGAGTLRRAATPMKACVCVQREKEGQIREQLQKVEKKIFSAYPSSLKIVPIFWVQFFPARLECLGSSTRSSQHRWNITKAHQEVVCKPSRTWMREKLGHVSMAHKKNQVEPSSITLSFTVTMILILFCLKGEVFLRMEIFI
ncbi:hypothetical protein TNCT_603241 [Trichonephila clavata]|uniref:Uncharacterized protein n=1 Tax=Trichonephila clavata TaxID=2740835 RepID=A0A8X6I2I1_TRICU|nr:hypothetical protein TNCT_603241 [Trichonephila clavata]